MRRLASALRRTAWLAAALLLLLAVWLGGFAWFVGSSLWIKIDRASPTDAIVVLTGGEKRPGNGAPLVGTRTAAQPFVFRRQPAGGPGKPARRFRRGARGGA